MSQPFSDDEIVGKAFDLQLLRRLVRFLVPYRGLFLVSVVLVLCLTAIQIGLPYVTKLVIDRDLTLSRAVVTLDSVPADRTALPLGDGRYLVDLSKANAKTRRAWEATGALSSERYAFVAEGSRGAAVAAREAERFIPVPGGYIVEGNSLRNLASADRALVRGDALAGLVQMASLFIGGLFLRFLLAMSQVYLLQYTGQRVMFDMRRALFQHVLRLPARFFDRAPVGRLVTRVTNDVEAINEMFTSMLVSLFRDAFLLVGVLAIVFHLEWRLALVVLILFPVIVIAAVSSETASASPIARCAGKSLG